MVKNINVKGQAHVAWVWVGVPGAGMHLSIWSFTSQILECRDSTEKCSWMVHRYDIIRGKNQLEVDQSKKEKKNILEEKNNFFFFSFILFFWKSKKLVNIQSKRRASEKDPYTHNLVISSQHGYIKQNWRVWILQGQAPNKALILNLRMSFLQPGKLVQPKLSCLPKGIRQNKSWTWKWFQF